MDRARMIELAEGEDLGDLGELIDGMGELAKRVKAGDPTVGRDIERARQKAKRQAPIKAREARKKAKQARKAAAYAARRRGY